MKLIEVLTFYFQHRPLQIGVMNFNKVSCTKYFSSSLICYIQEQLDDDNVGKVFIDDTKERWFNKFAVEVEDEVQQYLNKFQNCVSFILQIIYHQ
jgi:hypothetical protein